MKRNSKALYVGMVITLLAAATSGAAVDQKKADHVVREHIARVLLEIDTPGRQLFYIPVLPSGKRFAVLPGTENGVSGVLIIPQLKGRRVDIEVSVLFGDLERITSCQQLSKMVKEPVGTYSIHLDPTGGEITIFDLMNFAVAPVDVRVVQIKHDGATDEERALIGGGGITPQCSVNCCCCGSIECCPNPGRCIECADCGLCCSREEPGQL